MSVSWLLLLCIGIIAVTMEQFIHLTQPDSLSKKARPPLLHARRKKFPANTYVYIFDEPGIFLHPQGQRDLIQVFERLADENQVVYATHSLFMLNQNFPERHRLVIKDANGTRIDHKPYKQNWKLATDALGVYLASNILFSSKVLLVEGDSDPIYLYELFRQLNRLEEIDVDVNRLGIMSFSDTHNLRFLLQLFKREGPDTEVHVLVDGDDQGKAILDNVKTLTDSLHVSTSQLPDGTSAEDLCIAPEPFLAAVEKTIRTAIEAEAKAIPSNLDTTVSAKWTALLESRGKGEKMTGGRWFKQLAKDIFGDEASKVGLARNYIEACRELKALEADPQQIARAKGLCLEIKTKLKIPSIRARKTIET